MGEKETSQSCPGVSAFGGTWHKVRDGLPARASLQLEAHDHLHHSALSLSKAGNMHGAREQAGVGWLSSGTLSEDMLQGA
jgi:hypothetical protein